MATYRNSLNPPYSPDHTHVSIGSIINHQASGHTPFGATADTESVMQIHFGLHCINWWSSISWAVAFLLCTYLQCHFPFLQKALSETWCKYNHVFIDDKRGAGMYCTNIRPWIERLDRGVRYRWSDRQVHFFSFFSGLIVWVNFRRNWARPDTLQRG